MKNLKKHINIFIALTLLSVAVSAQNKSIAVQGTVTDETGAPMPGTAVYVEGTQIGQITDEGGKYKIQVQSNGALVFSFLGYKEQVIPVLGMRQLNVRMEPDTELMEEIVVVGYGTMKRSDLTGAVSSVSAKSIENFKTASVADALGGMVAGVNITSTDGTPGSGFDIKIRGVGSVNNDSSPLYIVDGFEVDGLHYLANQDIASIEVLKDASAAAIYGARGANGVVLVTTKSGRPGRTQISYNGSASYRTLSKKLDLLTPYEYVDLQMELNPARYEGVYYRTGEDALGNPYKYQTMDDYIGVAGVDWQDQSFRPTWSQNHDLSVRGGNNDTQYLMSFSHFDEQGIFQTSDYAKNSVRLKLTQKLFKWATFNATVTYTNQKRGGVGTGGSMLSNILMYRPTGGVLTSDYDLRHNAVDPIAEELGVNTQYYNPLVNAENTDKLYRVESFEGSAGLSIQLARFFSYKLSGYYNITTSRHDTFYKNGTSSADRGSGPYGSSDVARSHRYTITNQLVYNRLFQKKHKLTATLAHESYYRVNETFSAEAKDFPIDNIGVDNLGLGAAPSSINSSKADSRRLSFFARAFYSYNERYMLTATFRTDASSVFSSKNKWGFFPSFSAAWNISNESFLKGADWITNMKLRAGWGLVGNDRITNYLSLSLLNNFKYGVGGNQLITFSPSHLANEDLKWEASSTTNMGIDLGFFHDRLNITADAFLKDSKDLLLKQDLSFTSGFESQWQNVGKLRNKGIELTVNSININKKNFSWTTDFNISFIRNTLVSLNSDKDYILSRSGISSNFASYDYIAREGEPLGNMYGYVFDGVYQTSDFEMYADGSMHLKEGVADISEHYGAAVVPGVVKYKDISGPDGVPDGRITEDDRTIIGNGQPKGYGGISNSFLFYGIDFSFMLQFAWGNDIYNAQRMFACQSDLEMQNMMGEVRYRWAADYASNKVPSAKGIIRTDIYSRFIEDGSFLRLKNITLGYTLPSKWVRKIYLSKIRIYASAQNLFCLTKYSGYDPEVSMSSSNLMPGLDYGAYPKSRVWTVGAEINF